MKLLIQLVREILHLSGKSQGISETPGCGNHDSETIASCLGVKFSIVSCLPLWKELSLVNQLAI